MIWRNLISTVSKTYDDMIDDGGGSFYTTPTVKTIDPALTSPNLDTVLKQISGYEADIAKIIQPIPVEPVVVAPSWATFETPTDVSQASGMVPSETVQDNTQFIGMDEYQAIIDEGITIPETANVVIVPVSETTQPEVFDAIVTAKIQNPEVSITDIVSLVINPDTNALPISTTAEVVSVEVSDPVVEQIQENIKVVEMVQDNPGITVTEARYNVEQGNVVPVTYIDSSVQTTNTPQEQIQQTVKKEINLPGVPFDKILDVLDEMFGYQLDKDLTQKQIIEKNEDQIYKAGTLAILGILGLTIF